jgi:quinol monooxygenase YgiN
MTWIKYIPQKPPPPGIYLCYWQQDPHHWGYMVFSWIGDRWQNHQSLHSHNGTNYVTHYSKLSKP